MLTSFVETVLRMRDRMRLSDPRDGHGQAQIPVVPRPAAKPWKRPQVVRGDRRAISA
jgi:hypothetical protein